ncbi:MAG: hypothetical protein COV45_05265 [Deltaproteobacteria bacterium CG11_big_fil_rev_8_21_14_0_20_47_16]|nr:MAG: hypothetical protein COV45_05265 [Deltaproteobacteria bacterium CG11_big_fil_rev_8_21_14_0_20_47_16]
MKRKLHIIFVIALLVRILMLFHLGDTLHVDEGQMVNLKNWVAGHGLSDSVTGPDGSVVYMPTARDLPGHGILIIATWYLTGTQSLVPMQWIQIILDALMIFLVFGIGRRLFSDKVGLIAAALYALYLPEVYLAVLVRRDVWVSFGMITSFYCCVRFTSDKRWRWWLIASVVLSATAYFRSTVILYPFALGLGLLGFVSLKRAAVATAIMTVIIILGLLPWGIRNYIVFDGRFLLTELNFAQSMWEGFGQFPNPVGAINNDVLTEKRMREDGYTGRFATFEYEDFLKPKVFQTIKENPKWYLGTILQRIPRALVVNRVHWGIFEKEGLDYHTFHIKDGEQKGPNVSVTSYGLKMLKLNPGFIFTKFLDVLIFGMAIFGFWKACRRHFSQSILLGLVPFYFIATLIPIRIEGRYMVPTHWALLIFMAIAVNYISDRLRHRNTPWA